MATFIIHTVQYASVNYRHSLIIFSNEQVDGTCTSFTLTREQFFAFDDVIHMISRGNMQGYFPLGGNIYFNYHKTFHHYETELFQMGETYGSQLKTFVFRSFNDYKRDVHGKILSLLRKRDYGARRSSTRKRTLSDASKCSTQSPKAVNTGKGETLPRKTDNVLMSHAGETSAILPKWSDSNPGEDDARGDERIISHNLSSPEEVRLADDDCEMEVY